MPDYKTVEDLQFNVAQLLKEQTGATRHYDIEANLAGVLADSNDAVLAAPLTGSVKFLRTGRDILVTGVFQSTIDKECARCLSAFEMPIEIEVEELFFPTIDLITGKPLPDPEEADEANRISEVHILDLYEVVRQALVLESEVIRYCRPDCKGLCPHCGQDRNINPCDCENEVIDMRWAGLLELQNKE